MYIVNTESVFCEEKILGSRTVEICAVALIATNYADIYRAVWVLAALRIVDLAKAGVITIVAFVAVVRLDAA